MVTCHDRFHRYVSCDWCLGDPSGYHPSEVLDPSQFMLSKETHQLSSSAIFASSRSTSRETAPDNYRYRQRSIETDEQCSVPYAR